MVASGVCDAKTPDECLKKGFGPRRPVLRILESATLVGLHLTLDIPQHDHSQVGPASPPSRTPRGHVSIRRLGFKADHGFHNWTPAESPGLRARLLDHISPAQ
jgi:hypothetical protein